MTVTEFLCRPRRAAQELKTARRRLERLYEALTGTTARYGDEPKGGAGGGREALAAQYADAAEEVHEAELQLAAARSELKKKVTDMQESGHLNRTEKLVLLLRYGAVEPWPKVRAELWTLYGVDLTLRSVYRAHDRAKEKLERNWEEEPK